MHRFDNVIVSKPLPVSIHLYTTKIIVSERRGDQPVAHFKKGNIGERPIMLMET